MYRQWETNFHAVERWGYVGVHRMISWLRQVDWLLLSISLSLRVMVDAFFLYCNQNTCFGWHLYGFIWPFHYRIGWLMALFFEQFEIIAASWPLLEVFATPRCDFCLGERDMCCSMPFLVVILKHGFNLVSIFFDVIHLPYTFQHDPDWPERAVFFMRAESFSGHVKHGKTM